MTPITTHKTVALLAAFFAPTTLSACAAPNQIASTPISTTSSTRSSTRSDVQTRNVQTKSSAKIEKPQVLKPSSPRTLVGKAAFGGYVDDAPGVRRMITVKDVPAPYHTESAGNGPRIVGRPAGAIPKAPAGFAVSLWAENLNNPRVIVTVPNGDIFLAESGANRVRVLRDSKNSGKSDTSEIFADGLKQPFGIAFWPAKNPQWVYVANTDSVVRFPYRNGDLKSRGAGETIVDNVSSGGKLPGGGHWTRDIEFSKDGKKLYLSIGSLSNVDDNERENVRARIYEYSIGADGKRTAERVYAWGIRNPVGLAINPKNGEIWTGVNERDGLGDDLVPDYMTRVRPAGFYGWPWFYLGANQDPRHEGKRPDLKSQVIVPDVLLQAHSASLDLAFYSGQQFPREYSNALFNALHGSWNRSMRTGYKVVRAIMKNGVPTGEYEDFLTGFVTPSGDVWGRPVGVTTARDGSLLISEDGNNTIWRVGYVGKK